MDLKYVELISPNPCAFTKDFVWKFRIESSLPEPVPLTLGFVWVGSAKNSDNDIILDEIDLDNITPGLNEFVIDHPAPEISQLPEDELYGMTVLTISFAITGSPAFNRLAYLVDVGAYGDVSDSIRSGNSQPPHINHADDKSRRDAILQVLGRHVVADKPRLSVFPTDDWNGWTWSGDEWVKTGTGSVQQDGAANSSSSQQHQNNNSHLLGGGEGAVSQD
jgi:hypothetical protein